MYSLKKILVNKLNGIPLNLFIMNMVFQRVFRIDANCKLSKNYTSRVICPEKLHLEELSYHSVRSLALSGGCYINASEEIHIGKGTIWSFNVSIISQDHEFQDFDKAPRVNPIRIGKNCWIGAGAAILPGVELGDNTIVGANSVVTRSFVDGHMIIAGCPARKLRELA